MHSFHSCHLFIHATFEFYLRKNYISIYLSEKLYIYICKRAMNKMQQDHMLQVQKSHKILLDAKPVNVVDGEEWFPMEAPIRLWLHS